MMIRKTLRILQVSSGEVRIPAKFGGGIEARILEMSEHLKRLSHQVTIVDRLYNRQDAAVEYFNNVKIIRIRAPVVNLRFASAVPRIGKFALLIEHIVNQVIYALILSRVIQNMNFDVINIHNAVAALTFATISRNMRNKIVFSSHTARRSILRPGILDRIALMWENRLLTLIPKITVNSEFIRARLIQDTHISPHKVHVIPEGIDVEVYQAEPMKNSQASPIHQPRESIVLFVGRVTPVKGVDRIAEAAFILVRRLNQRSVRFVICGPLLEFGAPVRRSLYFEHIMRFVHENGLDSYVTFTGPVSIDRLKNLYSQADIFVLPSLFETSPSAIREAMAFGKPVIASNTGDIPTYVKNGETGFLITPGNAEELAMRIQYLLTHAIDRTRMGANARSLVVEKFDWSKVIERLVAVYNI
jgi:glycosyltransferase involved in cell wall biosynthesis